MLLGIPIPDKPVMVLCPFHVEQNPSCRIYPEDDPPQVHCYSCIPLNERIVTKRGLIKIGDVKLGDQVLTHRGKFARVSFIRDKESNEILEFRTWKGGRGLRVTPEHVLFIVERGRRGGIIERRAEFVREGDYLLVPKENEEQKNIWLEIPRKISSGRIDQKGGQRAKEIPRFLRADYELGWLIGLYIAEGHFYRGAMFTLNAKEGDLAQEILRIGRQRFGIIGKLYSYPYKKNSISVYLPNVLLGKWLREICGSGAARKHLPRDFSAYGSDFIKGLLDGHYAGDGSRAPRRRPNRKSCATISEELALQLQRALLHFGIIANIQIVSPHGIHKESFHLSWSEKRSPRRSFILHDFAALRIASINKLQKKEIVRDLEVKTDGSFVVNNLAVHNCGFHRSAVGTIAELQGKTVKEVLAELGFKQDSKQEALNTVVDILAGELSEGEMITANAEKRKALEFLTTVREHSPELLKKKKVGVVTQSAMDKILTEVSAERLRDLRLMIKKSLRLDLGAVVFPVFYQGEPVAIRWKRYSTSPKVGKQIDQMEKRGWIKFIYFYESDNLRIGAERLWITEGEDKVLRIEAQNEAALGLFGSGISQNDKRFGDLLASNAEEFVIAMDSDEGGKRAAAILKNVLVRSGRPVRNYVPQGNDIDDDLTLIGPLTTLYSQAEIVPPIQVAENVLYDNGRKIATFSFKIRAKIFREEGLFLVLEMRGEFEPKTRIVTIPNRLLGDKAAFNQFLKDRGLYSWLGSNLDLENAITSRLTTDLPIYYGLNYVGRVDFAELNPEMADGKGFFLPERAFLKNGVEVLPEEGVFFIDKKTGIFLEVPEVMVKSAELVIPDISPLEKLLMIINTPERLAALGWFVALLWKQEIDAQLGGFPILWLSGEKGSGKTTFITFLMGLFHQLKRLKSSIDPILCATKSTTPEGLSRALARYSCFPVLLDDLRWQSKNAEAFCEIMRALYDGFSIQKGRLNLRDSIKELFFHRQMRSGLVVTSQHRVEDEALNDRVLEVAFSKQNLDKKMLPEMKSVLPDLYPLGLSLMQKALDTPIKTLLGESLASLGNEVVADRKLQAVGITLAGLKMLGVSEEKRNEVRRYLLREHKEATFEADEIESFWELLRVLALKDQITVSRLIGEKEEGVWIAVSLLFKMVVHMLRIPTSFTSSSLKQLLQQQAGVVTFKDGRKDKVVAVKVGTDRVMSARCVFFQRNSKIGKTIRQLVRSEFEELEEEEKEEKEEGFEPLANGEEI
jgi:intein/homing endonuclease